MKDGSITTTDLAEFGYRELGIAKNLLNAMFEDGLPVKFEREGITVMFNTHSGCVFLTNDEYQVCMFNGKELEMYHTCHKCDAEGFEHEIEWNHKRQRCGACVAE